MFSYVLSPLQLEHQSNYKGKNNSQTTGSVRSGNVNTMVSENQILSTIL